MNNVIVVPKTKQDAIERVYSINDAIRAGKWERAIVTCALWNEEYSEDKTRGATDNAVGELTGTADRTVRVYLKRVRDHFGKDADKITFGAEVPMPDVPWEAITGGNSVAVEKVTPSMAKNVVEAAKMDPEIAAVVYDKVAIEETVGANDERPDKIGREEDPVIKAFIEYEELKRILEQAIPLINIYRAKGEAIQELELVLDKVVEAIEAKKWDEAQWDEALNKLLNESSDEETS